MKVIADSWLAGILQCDVYRLTVDDVPTQQLNNRSFQIGDLVEQKPGSSIFIYTKIATEALSVVKWVEQMGFNLIDTNIVFDKPISAASTLGEQTETFRLPPSAFIPPGTVRFATPADETQTVAVARENFIYSRFHLDSAIPRQVADTVKAEWVRNYFLGKRGQQMVVAEVEGRIVGFLQLLYGPDKYLVIDLIAVDKTQRRKAIASDMIAFAEANCGEFTHIRVGTQIANVPSMRLYEKIGFRVAEAHYVFHYHG